VTGGLSVFVASSQDTLPGNAVLPTSRMGQEPLDSPQETINKEANEFLMSGTANDLCCDGSVSDSLYDMIRDDLFVDVNHSCVVVKGHLRENIAFWQNIGASNWLLRVIREGYCLPFVELPEVKFFQNHRSALCNAEFVSAEISKLLKSGALVEGSPADLLVCSPLGVAMNSSGKLRLIVDLRYVNQHLRSCKFKYEDIRTAADLFQKGDWFFKFEYTSGYHHLEIFPEHTKFLGCSWTVDGSCKFFKFTVLPFGLSVGPFIFTRIQKALTKHWRRHGIRLFTYLDDGAGADSDFSEAQRVSDMVQADVRRSGFVANDVKSQWVPVQCGELLGYVLNLRAGTFQVPQRRVDTFHHVLRDVIAHKFVVSARTAARFTGLLASMSLTLGPVVRLWTRSLYRTSYKLLRGTALSSYLQMPKVRLFSGRRIIVIQAIRFGLLVRSLKF